MTSTAATQQKEQAAINVEDVYEKKTPVEHVLLRPGMYIGSVEETEQSMWVLDDAAGDHFVNKVMKYNPGLYKIFDEVCCGLHNKGMCVCGLCTACAFEGRSAAIEASFG